MVATIATNPVNGKSPQGCSFKHGEVKLSKASGTNITPEAKAFTKKKLSFSGRSAWKILPAKGRETPMPPAMRMQASAISLYFRTVLSLPLFSSRSQVQSANAMLVQVRTIIKFENGGTNLARYKSHSSSRLYTASITPFFSAVTTGSFKLTPKRSAKGCLVS
ncbi:hypothetical protein LXL04_010460 [Taraxacum kok-saghyz]